MLQLFCIVGRAMPCRTNAGLWRRTSEALALLAAIGMFANCAVETQKRALVAPDQASTLNKKSDFLKAHLRNGKVCILNHWEVSPDGHTVTGTGTLLGINREVLNEGHFTVPIDSVAIFETNVVRLSGEVGALSIVTGASVIMSIYCAANPKACFGSCPTFYVSDGETERLQAEGFSASIAPSLEASDIDGLYRARPTSPAFRVQMRNEALETHVVRYVDVLAAPRRAGGRVYASIDGKFRHASRTLIPSHSTGPEGESGELVRALDGTERVSLADSAQLDAKETLELTFDDVPDTSVGLVIGCRQSLLSTYLFYQSLAYMGQFAGQWLAQLERGGAAARRSAGGIGQRLGGIEVMVQSSEGDWVRCGEMRETGPLATDVHLVSLNGITPGQTRVRLVFTKGYWRIDYIGLAVIDRLVEPLRILPSQVFRDSISVPETTEALRNRTSPLTTFPGDIYTFVYELPDNFADYELFLESRGYYLEWMRDEWLADENPMRLAMMYRDPDQALRFLAPLFKSVEPQLESFFWSSRYAR